MPDRVQRKKCAPHIFGVYVLKLQPDAARRKHHLPLELVECVCMPYYQAFDQKQLISFETWSIMGGVAQMVSSAHLACVTRSSTLFSTSTFFDFFQTGKNTYFEQNIVHDFTTFVGLSGEFVKSTGLLLEQRLRFRFVPVLISVK